MVLGLDGNYLKLMLLNTFHRTSQNYASKI